MPRSTMSAPGATPIHPSTVKHVDIRTPSWRRFVPNCDHDESEDAESDSSEEAYINRHHEQAIAERKRWAGVNATRRPSNLKATPRTRAKLSSNKLVPIFPTPTECFHLMRRSLQKLQLRHGTPEPKEHDSLTHQRQLMLELETALDCYANIEETLRISKARLRAKVNSEKPLHHQRQTTQLLPGDRTELESDFRSPFALETSLRQSERRLSNNFSASPFTLGESARHPSLPSPLYAPPPTNSHLTKESVAQMNDQAFSTLNFLDGMFRRESASLRDHLRRLAREVKVATRENATFEELREALCDELKKHKPQKASNSSKRLAKPNIELTNIVRQEIQDLHYYELASSFNIHPDYCLDGTRQPVHVVAQRMAEHAATPRRQRTVLEDAHHNGEDSSRKDLKLNGVTPETGNLSTLDKTSSPPLEHDDDLTLPLALQTSRLDARRKLRQNVKRKLPRVQRDRRTRKAFRFRESAESISSRSSGGSSFGRWNVFQDDMSDTLDTSRRPPVSVQFQQVVNVDDKEDGSGAPVVHIEDDN